MKDEMLDMIKERLLDELIDKMSGMDSRLQPKGVGVEVQAKDPDALKEGLDKAKEIVGKSDMPPEMPSEPGGDDEDRLMELLSHDDDDEDEYGKAY